MRGSKSALWGGCGYCRCCCRVESPHRLTVRPRPLLLWQADATSGRLTCCREIHLHWCHTSVNGRLVLDERGRELPLHEQVVPGEASGPISNPRSFLKWYIMHLDRYRAAKPPPAPRRLQRWLGPFDPKFASSPDDASASAS